MALSSVRPHLQKCITKLNKLKNKSNRLHISYKIAQSASIGFVISGAIAAGTGITISTFISGGLTLPILMGTTGTGFLTIGTASSLASSSYNRKRQKQILDSVNSILDSIIAHIYGENIIARIASIRKSLLNDQVDLNHQNGGSSIYSQIFFLISEKCDSNIRNEINQISEISQSLLNFIEECKALLLENVLNVPLPQISLIAVYFMFESWSMCLIILFKEENKLPKKIQDIIDILQQILQRL